MIQSKDQTIQGKDQIINEMIHNKDQELAVAKLQHQLALKNLEEKFIISGNFGHTRERENSYENTKYSKRTGNTEKF